MLKDNLKRLREERGWTREDLAHRCGMSPYTIREIERGHTLCPRYTYLVKLASALAVNVQDLFRPDPALATGYEMQWEADDDLEEGPQEPSGDEIPLQAGP